MILKRILDISVSLLCLLLAGPAIFFIFFAILFTMGSPVFFRQKRPGLKGRPFYLAKFRTMRNPNKGEEDPAFDFQRLTRIGRFLRSTSLDEIPTLWNVLKGDMSLAGPRPLLMRYLDRYTPEQAKRHDVKPGITGWAQINGRNAITWEDKFRYDLWYVNNRSIWLDLKILFLTVIKVLKREGISHEDDSTMPEFMGTDKGTKAQRDKGTEGQRHRGTKAQRHRGTEGQRHRGTKAQRHRGTKAQRGRGLSD